MVNDPIADLLIQLKNAGLVKMTRITVSHSRPREAVLSVLRDKGFIAGYDVVEKTGFRELAVTLKYDEAGKNVIRGVKKVSKPSRRIYVACKDIIRWVRGANRVGVISTSRGIMSHDQAIKQNLGGELLSVLWS